MTRRQHIRAVPDELSFEDDERAEERKFYFAASDHHGHREQVNVKFPPDHHARVAALASNSKTPYRSIPDVWRDAMYHHLVAMEEWLEDDEFSAMMELTKQQAEISRVRHENMVKRELVESTTAMVEEVAETGQPREIREAIVRGQEVVEMVKVGVDGLERMLDIAQHKLTMMEKS